MLGSWKALLALSALLLGGCKIDQQASLGSGESSQLATGQVKRCPDGSVASPKKPCKTVAPDPVVVTTPTTATTVLGEVAIADNFDTQAGIEVFDPTGTAGKLPSESTEEVGAFRMRCNAGQLLSDDPIVYPGQPGASHLHQFWGNTGTNAKSTYESLRTSGGTTCGASNAPVNRTAYWMPAMLDGKGGVVKPDYINTYYKQVPAANCFKYAAKGCVGLPHGIRMVFGYNMATGKDGPTDPNSHSYWSLRYECWKSDTDSTQAVAPPAGGRFRSLKQVADAGCPVGAQLNIFFSVPGCWDGVNLDSADHRSHFSFGTPESGGQVCPSTHPYLITPWQGQIKYTVDANFRTWHLSSDTMHNSEPGSTLHFDYWEAWSPTIKDRWQKNCVDGHKSCSSGDLGDGFWIKQTPVTAPHQVVPIS